MVFNDARPLPAWGPGIGVSAPVPVLACGAMTDANKTPTSDTTPEPDELTADHGGSGWIAPFVSWARGEVDVLDFAGASIPDRLRVLLTDAELPGVDTGAGHDEVDAEPEA